MRSDNNLILPSLIHNSFYTFYSGHFPFIRYGIILKHKPETCHTVCNIYNIFFPADSFYHFL